MHSPLKLAGALALVACLLPAATLAESKNYHRITKFGKNPVDSLGEAASRSRRLAGVAASYGTLFTDEQYESILSAEFNYITPENVGKWGPLQPVSADEWDFTLHDQVVDYSAANGMAYKGHALVWHQQAPSFITDSLSASELQNHIDQHIATTVGRYAGQIYAWDVVNEAMGDDGQLRDSVFYRVLGEDYIANAFYAAHAADPRAKLYYNDYSIAGINAKSDAVYEMLKGLKEAGVPVDGIGFQMHLVASNAPSYRELVENFRRFAALGLRVNVSELDVRISDLPWDHQTKLAIQRQVYHRVVSACTRVRACEAVTTWGISDQYSWIDSTFGADDPLPWDEEYNRKPAYYGMVDGFMGLRPDSLEALPNLLANGNVEAGLEGWTTWAGTLERLSLPGLRRGSSMILKDRTDTWNGVVYDLTDQLQPNQAYDVAAWAMLAEKAEEKANGKSKSKKHKLLKKLKQLKNQWKHTAHLEDSVEINAKLRCEDGADEYFNLAIVTASGLRWSKLNGELVTPDCALEEAVIYVSGPQAGVDLIVDRVSVRPQMLVPDNTGYGPNLVANPFFEEDASGWFGFGDPVVEASWMDAKSGSQSGYVTNRTASWQGPATSILEGATPGDVYNVFAWVSLMTGSATVNATVKASCPDGDQFIWVNSAQVAEGTWTLLTGDFVVPDCDLSELTLYFEGPDANVDMFIDDVYVRMDIEASKDEEPTDNIIINPGFETDTAGWSAWGGASLTVSSNRARSGDNSGLLSNRSGSWQGHVYNLLGHVGGGATLNVSAWGMIEGAAQDSMNITLKVVCEGEAESYNQLAAYTVNDAEWTELVGSITLPACTFSELFLYFDGPAAGVNTYLDDVYVTADGGEVDPNLVANGDFEADLSGWQSWGGSLLISGDEAYTGSQSAVLSARVGSWEGPVYPLGPLDANGTYEVSGWVKIAGVASDSASITIKTVCADGTENYNGTGGVAVNDQSWTQVYGQVAVPDCTITESYLYFGGPSTDASIYLDNVEVSVW